MSVSTAPRLGEARERVRDEPGPWTLLVLLASVFMTTLDFFIVNVAIPATQRELRAGPAAVQLIVAGFGLALAAGLITGGRLGDLVGRRRMFAVGLVGFTAASAACGLAPGAGFLIGARVAQGVAAALLMPQVLGIINTVYTGPHRARAFTAYGVAIGFGGVFGQLIGGALIRLDVAGLGWRSIFLINVPIGVLAVAVTRRLVPLIRPAARPAGGSRLDLPGVVLVALGLVAVVYPLVQGQQAGWPAWTWLCLAASVPLLGGFALYQWLRGRRGGAPLIDVRLFAGRAFSAGVAINLVFQTTMASFFLILALYLQDGRGLSPLRSGLIFLPLGVGYFASSTVSGRLAARLGRQVIAVGALVVAAGYGLLALTAAQLGTASVLLLVPGLLVAGAGMGFVIAPLPAIVLSGVAPGSAASASGVLSTCQQAGGAIGVAVIGVVFYRALGGGFPHAFALGLLPLVALEAVVAGLAQLLPGRAAR
jgi:EmrB/QacA subfamily drug resistance transporter